MRCRHIYASIHRCVSGVWSSFADRFRRKFISFLVLPVCLQYCDSVGGASGSMYIFCSCNVQRFPGWPPPNWVTTAVYVWFISRLLLSERTPLEHCCVHNMSPFILSSGLSLGSHEAKVQRAKVCLNCAEPSVARSSYWSLPVGRYLSDSRCKGSVVILARWTARNMAKEPQTSVHHQVRKQLII